MVSTGRGKNQNPLIFTLAYCVTLTLLFSCIKFKGVGKKYETQCKEYIIKCTFMHKGKITQITARNPVSCGAKILLFIGILINLFLLPHCLIIKIAK